MIIKTAEYYRVRRKNKRRKKNKNTINKKFVGNFKIKRKNGTTIKVRCTRKRIETLRYIERQIKKLGTVDNNVVAIKVDRKTNTIIVCKKMQKQKNINKNKAHK